AFGIIDSSIVKAKEQSYGRQWFEVLQKLEATEARRRTNPNWFRKGTNDTLDVVVQQLHDRTPTLEIPPNTSGDSSVHVNSVIVALSCESPPVGSPQFNAWPVFGGVCYNAFPSRTTQWEARPMTCHPLTRGITMNWITNMLYAIVDVLIAYCEAPLPPLAPDMYRSIPIATAVPASDAHLFQDTQCDIHVVHLPHLKTYHLAKYTKLVLNVAAAAAYENSITLRRHGHGREQDRGTSEAFRAANGRDTILLMHRQSRYGKEVGYFDTEWMLSRQFVDMTMHANPSIQERYCSVACSMTRDAKESRVQREQFTNEWATWSVYQKRRGPDGEEVAELIEMAVSMGVQDADTNEFVPYDEKLPNEALSPNERFNVLVDKLKEYYKAAFARDTNELLEHLRELPPSEGSVSSRTDEPPGQMDPLHTVVREANPRVPQAALPDTTLPPPRVHQRRKRSRRDDVFEAAKVLCTRYASDFKPDELARVANVFSNHALDATIFLGLGDTPVQKAWVADIVKTFHHD
ncbi:hypothetical protein DYB32_009526, partial [Aphanomyces invadans]